MKSLPEQQAHSFQIMFQTLSQDFKRKAQWREVPFNAFSVVRLCFSEGSTAQILYRAMRFCQTHGLAPLALLLYRLNASVSHLIIGRGADIAPGFVILHSFGIVINTGVRAGCNLIIEHGVTIGAEKGQCPIIGNNVYIGAGAKIIGPVRIGSNVKIGANAVVTKDLPDGATAVGVPARIIRIYGQPVEGKPTHRAEPVLRPSPAAPCLLCGQPARPPANHLNQTP